MKFSFTTNYLKQPAIALFTLLFIFRASPEAKGQLVYTSIADGAWTNTTSVWSTDGATPCGCAPSPFLFNFDVVINHDITHTGFIRNFLTDTLTIGVAGSLSGNIWLIPSGPMINNGALAVDSIRITAPPGRLASFGVTDVVGTVRVEGGDLDVYTSMTIGGDLIADNGNTFVYPSAYLAVDGDFNLTNGGSARNVASSSCIAITGNINVGTTSIVAGFGGISALGNINNAVASNWDPNVLWCALGTGTGLPTASACGANACLSALPVTLQSYDGVLRGDGSVELEWVTTEELNNDFFTIEKSTDGETFSDFTTVQSADGFSTSRNTYTVTDPFPSQGQNWYRLRQTDLDGTTKILGTVSIQSNEDIAQEMQMFPNPSNGVVKLSFAGMDGKDIDVRIFDYSGRTVFSSTIASETGFGQQTLDLTSLPSGGYMAVVTSGQARKSFKLIRE